ncbi:MAG: ferredoxin--NADP reductase [Hyphomonadaceae bacterium]|nr:ferredoxin--NADP reductase [Hyphomonadaceae bacterium]
MTDSASAERVAPPPNLHVSRVESVRHYTESLFAFTCERPPGLRFRSGEFVMIGLMNGAKPLLRAYSIASPAWDDRLAFYSIKLPDGPLTSRLQNVRPGDEILIGRKPTGTLVLDALMPGRRLFLLSTGTGIAPFASLVRDPETYERFDEVIVTHTCRTAAELHYGREVVAEALADPLVGEEASVKLRHITSLTRERHGLEGRITTLIANGGLFEHANMPAFDPQTDRLMICGSAAVLSDLKEIAIVRGFTEGSNHEQGSFVVERAFAG